MVLEKFQHDRNSLKELAHKLASLTAWEISFVFDTIQSLTDTRATDIAAVNNETITTKKDNFNSEWKYKKYNAEWSNIRLVGLTVDHHINDDDFSIDSLCLNSRLNRQNLLHMLDMHPSSLKLSHLSDDLPTKWNSTDLFIDEFCAITNKTYEEFYKSLNETWASAYWDKETCKYLLLPYINDNMTAIIKLYNPIDRKDNWYKTGLYQLSVNDPLLFNSLSILVIS